MKTIINWIRHEAVLCIAFLAALVSSFFIPPDKAWLGYFDLRTLALLYCLMTVVAGLRIAGTFDWLAHVLCRKAGSIRLLGIVLVGLSFFSSMLITNDVALLTFVPFAAVVLEMAKGEKHLTYIVVLQAVAANLGSMLLPVGNPQNLYMHSHYGMQLGQFLGITFPVWLASLVLILALCLLLPRKATTLSLGKQPTVPTKSLLLYLALFAVCLSVVFRLLTWPIMLGILLVVLFFYDRSILKKADLILLLTFVCFFIFAGNLARIPAVDTLLRRLLQGREYWVALLSSQVISNVPATILLSGFTDNAKALLWGTNIGGLGTPIASLASLIALRLYARTPKANSGRFLGIFTLVNAGLLLVLCLLFH